MHDISQKLALYLTGKSQLNDWADEVAIEAKDVWGGNDDGLERQIMVSTLNALLLILRAKPQKRAEPQIASIKDAKPKNALDDKNQNSGETISNEAVELAKIWGANFGIKQAELRRGSCKLTPLNYHEGVLEFIKQSTGFDCIKQVNDYFNFSFPVEREAWDEPSSEFSGIKVFDPKALERVFEYLIGFTEASNDRSAKNFVLELREAFRSGLFNSGLILGGLAVPGITFNILSFALDGGYTEALALLSKVTHHEYKNETSDIMTAALNDEVIMDRCSSSLSISKKRIEQFVREQSKACLTFLELTQLTDASDYCILYLPNFDQSDYENPDGMIEAYLDTVYKLKSGKPRAECPLTFLQATSIRAGTDAYCWDDQEHLRDLQDSLADADNSLGDPIRYLELAHKAFLLDYGALGSSFLIMFLIQSDEFPEYTLNHWERFCLLYTKVEHSDVARALKFTAEQVEVYLSNQTSIHHQKVAFLVQQKFQKLRTAQLKSIEPKQYSQPPNTVELPPAQLDLFCKDARKLYLSAKLHFSIASQFMDDERLDWGPVAVSFFKPIESEIKYRLEKIFVSPQYQSELRNLGIKINPKDKHIPVGAILLAFKKPEKWSDELTQQIHSSNVFIQKDKKLAQDLINLSKVMNPGAHTGDIKVDDMLNFLNSLYGEKQIMGRFLNALQEPQLVDNPH